MIFQKKTDVQIQSFKEEIANAITHGIGVFLSLIAFVVLLKSSVIKGSTRHIVACSLYGTSLLILYIVSTLYHSFRQNKAKNILRILDHICIYLLIAGTYMPLTLVVLYGIWGWILFSIQCVFSLLGILFKVFFGTRYPTVSVIFYVLMGCMALPAMKPISEAISLAGFMWIILGGVFYIFGILFFAIDQKVSYFHTIWHLFVLAGSACHFIMVFFYVIPFQ